jgi:hypothetical protein
VIRISRLVNTVFQADELATFENFLKEASTEAGTAADAGSEVG